MRRKAQALSKLLYQALSSQYLIGPRLFDLCASLHVLTVKPNVSLLKQLRNNESKFCSGAE